MLPEKLDRAMDPEIGLRLNRALVQRDATAVLEMLAEFFEHNQILVSNETLVRFATRVGVEGSVLPGKDGKSE